MKSVLLNPEYITIPCFKITIMPYNVAFPKSQQALHFTQSLRSTWQPVKNYSINTFIFWGILIPDIRVVQCLLWKSSSMCHLLIFLFDSWWVGDLTLKFHVVCEKKKKPNSLWKFCVLKLGARLKPDAEVDILDIQFSLWSSDLII